MYKLFSKIEDLKYFLEGKKTYLVAFITAAVNLLVALGVSVPHINEINMVLVALGGAAIRAGINKV